METDGYRIAGIVSAWRYKNRKITTHYILF